MGIIIETCLNTHKKRIGHCDITMIFKHDSPLPPSPTHVYKVNRVLSLKELNKYLECFHVEKAAKILFFQGCVYNNM